MTIVEPILRVIAWKLRTIDHSKGGLFHTVIYPGETKPNLYFPDTASIEIIWIPIYSMDDQILD